MQSLRNQKSKLLLSITRTSGGNGQRTADGGSALLAPGLSNDVLKSAASGWLWIQKKLFGAVGDVASSGGPSTLESRGGGGGGGFNGGWTSLDEAMSGERRMPTHSAGGGGGSFCNGTRAESCEIEAGGNERGHGVLRIEEFRCF